MRIDERGQHILRKCDEKRKLIIAACKRLQAAIILENLDTKRSLARELSVAVNGLSELLIDKDIPVYLKQLSDLSMQFHHMKAQVGDVLEKLIETQRNFPGFVWPAADDSALALDLDAIFAAYVAQSRLPELLKLIMDILIQIEAESEHNSELIRVSLERAIATIRRARGASFPSMRVAWEFLIRLLGNFFWEQMAALLPGADTLITALKKTIAETDVEMKRAEKHVESEVSKYLTQPALSGRNMPVLELYGVRGDVLALGHVPPSIEGKA